MTRLPWRPDQLSLTFDQANRSVTVSLPLLTVTERVLVVEGEQAIRLMALDRLTEPLIRALETVAKETLIKDLEKL
jgi:hypothetical protein